MSKETYTNAKRKRKGYTTVENVLTDDNNITLQAKGLMLIFLSNSDDWKINMPNIISRSKNGRDAHYKVVNELIEHGYFARIYIKSNTKHVETIYIFSDVKEHVSEEIQEVIERISSEGKTYELDYMIPVVEKKRKKEKPVTGNQETEKPLPEFQDTESAYTEIQDINNLKTNNLNVNNLNLEEEDKANSHSPISLTPIEIDTIVNELRITFSSDLRERSFNTVVKLAVSRLQAGKVHTDFREYLLACIVRKIEELEARKQKDVERKQTKKLRRNPGKSVRKEELAESVVQQQKGEQEQSGYADMLLDRLNELLTTFKELAEIGNTSAIEQLTRIEAEIASRLQVTG